MDKTDLRKKVGLRLKEARKQAGYTQVTLAKELSLSPMMISRYEVGLNDIPYKHMTKIAKLLDKTVSYFFGEDSTHLNKTWDEAKKMLDQKTTQMIPKDMLAFSLDPNANKEKAIKEAKNIMKNWYTKNNMQKSTQKDFNTWWEGQ